MFTYKAFEKAKQKSIFVLSGAEVPLVADVLSQVNTTGVRTTRLKMGLLGMGGVQALRDQGAADVNASTNTVVCEVIGEDSMAKVSEALGGHGWCMKDRRQWKALDDKVFKGIISQASSENGTCAVVKPHALVQGNFGNILKALFSTSLNISGLQMFYLSRHDCQEFFEVYKGVMQEFPQVCDHVSSGACVAIALNGDNSVQSLRDIAGPIDPEVAKYLRPDTLRAL